MFNDALNTFLFMVIWRWKIDLKIHRTMSGCSTTELHPLWISLCCILLYLVVSRCITTVQRAIAGLKYLNLYTYKWFVKEHTQHMFINYDIDIRNICMTDMVAQ